MAIIHNSDQDQVQDQVLQREQKKNTPSWRNVFRTSLFRLLHLIALLYLACETVCNNKCQVDTSICFGSILSFV